MNSNRVGGGTSNSKVVGGGGGNISTETIISHTEIIIQKDTKELSIGC